MDQNLLFIRDDAGSMRHVTDALQAHGYSVATRSNSEFSLDPAYAADFDLILIDHSEPEINALEICTDLRLREVEAPVIVFAPPNPVQQRVAIFKAGADDYLLKPIDLDELHARVVRLLERIVRMRKSDVIAYEFGPFR